MVDTSDEVLAKHFYSFMGNYVNDELLPLLENKLDSYQLNKQIFITDSVNIELEGVTKENFREKCTQKILDEFDRLFLLKVADNKPSQYSMPPVSAGIFQNNDFLNTKRINETTDVNSFQQLDPNHGLVYLLVHFLETGQFPWWGLNLKASFNEEAILLAVQEDVQFLAQLICRFTISEIWIQRLKVQFSLDFSVKLIQILKRNYYKYRHYINKHTFFTQISRIIEELHLFDPLINSEINVIDYEKYKKGLSSAIVFTELLFNPEGIAVNPNDPFDESIEIQFFDILINQGNYEKSGTLVYREIENKLTGLSDDRLYQVFERFIQEYLTDHSLLLKLESHFTSQFTFWFYKSLFNFVNALNYKVTGNIGKIGLMKQLIASSVLFKSIVQKIPGYEENWPVFSISEMDMESTIMKTDKLTSSGNSTSEIDYFKEVSKDKKNELFIDNAGLVLLNPFLVYFFKEFNLAVNDEFVNKESQATAIHLLHYLAVKIELSYEFELTFEKYLCGWPLHEPVIKDIQLTERMKEEAETLLSACIKHWTVLKSTSPDGLRESFLQRKGKLEITGELHRLVIETSTIDILLKHLPWNISLLKLPWLKQVLHVSWSEH